MSCAAAMEVALRQRLEGVALVSISESAQTAEVVFAPGDHRFSADVFTEALRSTEVEVVSMHVDACGVVEGAGDSRRLRAGKTDIWLTGTHAPSLRGAVCAAGRLRTENGRMQLEVDRLEPAPEAVRGR